MRIGIVTPIVTAVPGSHSSWELNAGINELAQVAEVADRLGFHHLTCSEHVGVPKATAEQRGGTYWDPLATFGFLAARTHRIRLATQVLVLGYHHPLQIAKQYGTLDRVSGGRLILGVGVGSLEEEFELLGADFAARGAKADEAMAALRASIGQEMPEYHGEHYNFSGFVVNPPALQQQMPLWVGGRTLRSLRRAAAHGDGWVPFGLNAGQLTDLLRRVELPQGFDVVLSTGRQLDPIGDAERAVRSLIDLREAGATIVGTALAATSLEHYCEQLSALSVLADKVAAA